MNVKWFLSIFSAYFINKDMSLLLSASLHTGVIMARQPDDLNYNVSVISLILLHIFITIM